MPKAVCLRGLVRRGFGVVVDGSTRLVVRTSCYVGWNLELRIVRLNSAISIVVYEDGHHRVRGTVFSLDSIVIGSDGGMHADHTISYKISDQHCLIRIPWRQVCHF